MDLSPISRVISGAMAHAGTLVSEMTGCPIEMSVPKVLLVKPEELPDISDSPERPVVAAYVGFTGEFKGHALFMLDVGAADRIIDTVLGEAKKEQEMVASVLSEMGNIACCAVANSLADQAGVSIVPQPPAVVQDMNGALLESVATVLVGLADEVLVARTSLYVFGQEEHGYLLYIPERSCFERLVSFLEVH